MKKYLTIKNGIIGILVVALYTFLFSIYYARFTSFVFFDEYANILAGHLLLEGRTLYSEQFFNHQMLPVYLSSAIQWLLQPDSLYKLILYHRVFIFVISAVAGIVLIYKLRWMGLGIVLLYEFAKYYLFGYLFLAEGIIVYIHMYLFYLAWRKLQGNTISRANLILAAIGAWFVVWSREPYVLLAVFLYGFILIHKKFTKKQWYSFGVFLVLSVITFITVPIYEYLYQVVYVNYKTVFSYQLQSNQDSSLGIFSMFFYPLYIFLEGEMNPLRIFLMGMSTVFLISLGYYVYKTKKYLHALFIMIILGLANVRMVQPGTQFYGAFYMIQWYALFVMTVFLLLGSLWKYNAKFVVVMGVSIGIIASFFIFQKDSYVVSSVDRDHLFSFQYDNTYITGQAVRLLAEENDRLFIDLSDSFVFWQADIPSSSKYVVYYPVMNDILKYRTQRLEMFKNSPPEFYYTNCLEGKYLFDALPQEIRYQYAPFSLNNEPSCLFVLKERARQFTDEQIRQLGDYRFTLSPSALQ